MHARWLSGAIVGIALGVAMAAGDATRIVKWAADRVTVKATKAQTADLLAEVAKLAGAQVKGDVRAPREADFDFEDVPTKQALERILGEQNFTLTYEQGTLKVIDLRGGPEAPDTAKNPQTITKAGGDGVYPESWNTLWKLFDGRDKVPVDGEFGKKLGRGDAVGWDVLTNTAIADQDPTVRRDAVRAGMKALEADTALRDGVIAATANMSDTDLATFARAMAYHRAEDFVRNIVRSASTPDFRTRGQAVLVELGKMPFEGDPPEEFSRSRAGD